MNGTEIVEGQHQSSRALGIEYVSTSALKAPSPIIEAFPPLTPADSRTPVLYINPQIHRLGHLAIESFYLTNVYPREDFAHTVVCYSPSFRPKVNLALLEIAMRGLTLCFADNVDLKRLYYQETFSRPIMAHQGTIYHLDFWKLFREFNKQYAVTRTINAPFALTEKEKTLGATPRAAIGIPDGMPIVTIHAREGGYLPELAYHSYRDVSIQNYIPAIQYLRSQGYAVVRLGDPTMTRLSIRDPLVIDLPFHPRYHPLMESYFISESTFYVGMNSGPNAIAMSFDKPFLCLNTLPHWMNVQYGEGFFIPKKLYSDTEKRLLSYREIIDSPIIKFDRAEDFSNAGLTLVENTPDEILDAVREMNERLAHRYQGVHTGERLRARMREIELILDEKRTEFSQQGPKPYAVHTVDGRCGTEFLKKHRYYIN